MPEFDGEIRIVEAGTVSFEESTEWLNLDHHVHCGACNGHGCQPGAPDYSCGHCGGTGIEAFECELCGETSAGALSPVCDRCDDLEGWMDQILAEDFG